MKIDPLPLALALRLLWTPLMFFVRHVAFMHSRSAPDRVRVPHARL